MLDQTKTKTQPRASLSGSSPIKRRKATYSLEPNTDMPSRRAPSKQNGHATARMTAKSIAELRARSAPISHGDPTSAANEATRTASTNIELPHSSAELIASIRGAHRQRQDFHRAEKSLTLQIKAIERRLSGAKAELASKSYVPREPLIENGEVQVEDDSRRKIADAVLDLNEEGDEGPSERDTQSKNANVAFFATEPLVLARAAIKPHRMKAERECQKMAKSLQVWPWVDSINGFGSLGLAQIVGEAGDLSLYSNPAKLWKRFGLAVFDGKSQRRVSGAAAIEQGYSPVRRAIMFCIGDSLLKKQNAYRDLYLVRKVTEQAKLPDGSKMHWHRRAQRYTEKRLLRDLWRAWRDQSVTDAQVHA